MNFYTFVFPAKNEVEKQYEHFFNPEEVSFFGKFEGELALMCDKEVDLQIHFFAREDRYMSWVASNAKNKFSVGFSGADQRINDLVFDFAPKATVDLSKRIGQVFNHFGKVRSMNELKGTGVAMITPFNQVVLIDYGAFPKLIDHYIDSGIDYLVVLGTTAETATLSKQEHLEVIRKVAEINAGRLPLVLGKGGNNTHALVEEIQTTNFDGYSAILSVCPYYNRPNQEGIFQHFKAVAEASPLPVMLYNVPARTGASP